MKKKGFFKKTILATIIASTSIVISPTASARWCGNPICPGDVLTDKFKEAANAHLQAIKTAFTTEQLIPAIQKQMETQLKSFQQQAMGGFTLSQMGIGGQTDTRTEIQNRTILRDLQPIRDEACQVMTWQQINESKPKEVSEQEAMKSASRVALNPVFDTSKDKTVSSKGLSLYYRIMDLENTASSPLKPSNWMNKENIGTDEAKAGLLAVDMLTHVEGNSSLVSVNPNRVNTVTYKTDVIDNMRKALVLNITKNQMSDPIYKRLGLSNTSPEVPITKEDGSMPYKENINYESNENNQAFQDVITSSENYEDEVEEGKAVEVNKAIEESGQDSDYVETEEKEPETGDFIGVSSQVAKIINNFLSTPMQYTRITSEPGPRVAPTTGASTNHSGVDLAAPVGTPIYAAGDGDVIYAGKGSGFGYYVTIHHGSQVFTRYGHIIPDIPVSTGDVVKKGDLIAYSGNTGTSTGPHLHYEIRLGGDNGYGGDVVHPFARQGMSEMSALEGVRGGVLSANPLGNRGSTGTLGFQLADGETLPSELLRKLLLTKAIKLEEEWNQYKEQERKKFHQAVNILNKVSN